MTENMEQFLFDLAAKFGTTAEHLWQVLVNQAFIYAVMGSIILVVAIAISVIGAFALSHQSKKYDEEDERRGYETDRSILEVWFFVWLAYTGFLLIVGTIGITDIVTMFFNPEYWALKQILP